MASLWHRLARGFGAAAFFVAAIALGAAAQQPAGPQSTPAPGTVPGGLTPTQVEQIESVIRDYLLRNPEVIIEAVQGLERKQRAEQQRAAQVALAERRGDVFSDPASPVAGNPAGDVTLVEFFDYRCPYCKQVAPALNQLLKEDKKLRFVFKEFPILGPESVTAARAALAAQAQGKYHAFHNALMQLRGNFDEAAVMRVAQSVGLDVERLKTDMKKPEIEENLRKTYQLAKALNISGTPAFVIGERIIPGAIDLETLRLLIRQARQG